MAIAAIQLLSLFLPVSAVVVGGQTLCPTPTRVNEKLAQMGVNTAATSTKATHAAFLSRNGQTLLVTLRSAENTVLAERQFSAQASCEDLAAAAAVVIASWEGDLRSEGSLGLQVPSAIPVSKLQVTRAVNWDVGFAAQLGLAASSFSPGAWIEGSAGRQDSAWRTVISAFWQGNHQVSLGKGEALWRRAGAAIGPRLQVQRGRFIWSGELLAYVAYLQMQGRNQPQNASDESVDAGGMSNLRIGLRIGALVPWLSFGSGYSPFKRQVVVEPATSRRLPELQVSAMAGFSWLLGDSSAH